MKANNVADIYRLSPMQEGMLFHALYTPGADAYFRQLSYRLEGALDLAAFERAWQQVLERHAALRTSFYWQDLDQPLQVVQQKTPVPLELQDWKALSAGEQAERFAALLETEKNRPFKLAQAPLMRLLLVELGGDAFYFVWSYHHLLLDGWSKYLVLKEVFELYDAALAARPPRLAPARPYKDYIAWLRRQDKIAAENFWQRTLRGFRTPTPLPAAAPAARADANTEVEAVYGEEGLELSAETTAALKTLARQHQLTLNTLVQGAWALLLSRYNDEESVLFGVTVSGRPASLAGVEEMVGLFINTLPLRVEVPSHVSLLEWLKQIQAQQLELSQYEYSALVEIQGFSEVPRGLPLFESLVVFDNYPVAASLRTQGGLKYTRLATVERNNYPLTLVALADEQLHLRIPFDESRFTTETVRRMLGHLHTLLHNFAHAPARTLAQISLLTGEERQQLLRVWNETEDGATLDECLPEVFARQAEATPERTAVIFGEASLTYRELNERANQLAHHLRGLQVGREVRVGVCAERSLDTVTVILGILKAGGVYVPLAPDLPQERLSYMLEDLQVAVLITEQHLLWSLPPYAAASEVVCLDSDWMTIAAEPSDNPRVETSGDNLAYIIYTSGSTGQPKGVCITHAAAVNHFLNVRRNFALDERDRMLQFASLSFDVSLEQIFAPLISGAAVVLRENETWGRDDFYREARRHQLTVVNFPPAYWRETLEASGTEQAEDLAEQLKLIIIGGDAIAPQLIRLWQHSPFNRVRLLNAYGPTETIITATVSDISASVGADPSRTPQVTIGRPLVNRKIYILDRHGSPVPIGVAGELYIGGPLLARGYLNRPELTAERFLPDPFGTAGGRLYRTGDRARFLSDGSIEYLGRVDYQVKVRGFRIELGEIEAALSTHPQVSEVVVLAREDEIGDKRLVAYLVAEQATNAPVETGELRAFLKQQLPDYMIPAHYVWLESLPLTPNGKVDRKALPAPDHGEAISTGRYVAARTPVEELLVGIWEEVLRVERVGVTDNFFEMGGHSLLATQLVSRVREAFGVEVPLRTLFEEPTVAALSVAVEAALRDETEAQSAPPALVRFERTGDEAGDAVNELPLSYAQQRLWFLDQLESGSAAYNIPAAVRLTGALDVSALERAMGEVVWRHEVLRTTFHLRDGEPVQVIHKAQPLALRVTDISHLATEEREAEAGQLAAQEAARAFDLQVWPLVRAELLKVGDDEHVLLLTMHHIVSDGWSFSVLIKEVATLYTAYVAGEETPLAELTVQYADYARWQREWLTGAVLDRQLSYWREQLSGAPETLELPTDRVRPAVPSHRGGTVRVRLEAELMRRLKEVSRREGVTLYMLLLAAFQTLLSKYSGQEEVVVGSPIAGRTRAEVEGLIGFFVNTLALRGDLRGDPSFREVLHRVREVCLGAYAHQDVPFERLVEEVAPRRSLTHTPLFQVMFALQNTPQTELPLQTITWTPFALRNEAAKFELQLSIAENEGEWQCTLQYQTDLFEASRIERMQRHWIRLLEEVALEPARRLSQLEILTDEERVQLLEEWNHTGRLYEGEDLLHHLFERQAAQTPDSLALVFDDERLTYRELNERANRLAHYLRRHENVDVDTLVGVLMERSTEMVVSLLGILKAGAAYVPFDPSYPQERLAFMAQDAQVTLLLTQQRWRDAFSLSTGDSDELSNPRMLCLDTEWDKLSDESCENPQGVALGADNLAYMIYTSGSTGQPKGAMNTHGAIRNRLLWMQEQYQLTPDDRVLQKTPFSFDVSVWEFFWPLLTGAQLIVAKPGGHQDAAYLVELIKETGITTLHFVPSMLGVFLAEGGVSECRSVRQVMASGEALAAELVRRCYERMPQVRLHNLYGPTEAAVDVTAWACAREVSEVIPIGKPIANTQIYILDAGLQPVPVGVAGELYIAGVGLARGYLNRPELTAERFIPNPFRKDGGGRLYRTGDRARFLADGTIEYLGRVDYQVKVRGFRIELGEIEAALSAHARVNEAIVIAREDETGDKKLVAYLVAGVESVGGGVETATAPALTVKELRAHLAARLPDYMIPAHYVWLESLPLTPNGKVDRKALPAPDKTTGDVGGFVAPGTPVEEIVAGLFAAVLKLERVGVHDNFFELGGHSLLATQLVSRVREAFGVEVPLRTLFEAPTASALAAAVEAERAKSDAGRVEMPPPLVRGERGGAGEAALSYAQQRLWFLDQLEPGNVMFNLFQAARLGGELDVAAFERAVNEVVRRHESLRTTFEARAGAGVQVIHPPQPLTLEVIRLNHLPEAERETEARRLALEEARRPFDLQRGPLARVSLLKLTEDEHVLLCTMHHIVSDGWSLSVLVKEVATLYTAYVAGEETPLPELPVQYADYARWQREWLTGAVLDRQVAYWREQLRGAPETLELPTDRPRPEVQTFAGEKYPLAFSKALTEDLKALGRRENVTLFMTLVAAFQTLLHHHTGREDIVIGTDEANRTHGRTENLIGFFINQLVLRTNLSGVGSFRELLGRVRETALGAYAHRELPFEKLVEVVNPARSAKHAPVFQVKLVLQNMPAEELDMPGLRLEPFLVDTVAAKFELTPMLWEKPEGLAGWFEYNRDLFTSATVERFARQFELILSAVAAEPAVTLAELKERLATDDRAQLARERTGRAESLRQKFKSVKPKAVSLSDETLIKRSYLPGGEGALPLVVEPLEEQMSLPGWARSNRSLIERELHAHGAILFRGFNIATPDAFEQFAGAAVGGQLFNENGEHPRKSLSGNIYTPVAYPADKLLLWHNENSFNDRWPMKIMFCCAQPALVGGETPLVDSHQVFQLLDPKIRERFIERDVMYVRNYEVGLGLNWQTVLGTNDRARAEQYCRDNRMSFEWKEGDRLRTRAVRPAAARHPQTGKMVWFNQAQHWHVSCLDPAAREAISALFSEEDMPRNCYYGDGTPIEDSIMQEILGVYRQLEVCFPWRRGDVVLLDNMLAAHGRNPYRGERKLFVAMGEMMRCPETDAVPTPVS